MEDFHGTINGYANKNCRCHECKIAWADYNRVRHDDAGVTILLRGQAMPIEMHGTLSGYANWRCRCAECKAEWNKNVAPQWGMRKRKEAAHGTPSRYNNQKCRCPECKKAWADYLRPQRNEDGRTIRLRGKVMPLALHGTDQGYKRWGCRCSECKQMHAVYQAEYRRTHPQVRY